MVTQKPTPTKPKSVEKRVSLSMSDLVELDSFDDALAFMQAQGVQVFDVSEVQEFLGDGFLFLQKEALVNVPFLIVDVKHTTSPSYEVPMVTVRAMTATNKRVKFVDFGAGIRNQLDMFETRAGKSPVGMVVSRGLTSSDYQVCTACNTPNCKSHPDAKTVKGETFYLALDA
jgi:hypothetical protein